MMEKKEEYKKKIKAQLDLWDAEIIKLKAKAENVKVDAQSQYHESLQELERLRTNAQEKLNALNEIGDDTWQSLKGEVNNTWDNLYEGIKKAVTKFKE